MALDRRGRASNAVTRLGAALVAARRAGGARHGAHRRREHGQRDPADRGRARPRPPRLRADRLRRRRAAARPRGRGAARHDDRARPAASRAVLGLRRRDRRGAGRPVQTFFTRLRRMSTSPPSRDAPSCARARSPSCAGASTSRSRCSAAPPTCATPARTTSSRCRCRPASSTATAWAALLERFAAAHAQLYGFALPGEPIELINLRVTALSPEPPAVLRRSQPAAGRRPMARRPVWFDGAAADCAIHQPRGARRQGAVSPGPAVIEEVGFDHARLPRRRAAGRGERRDDLDAGRPAR